MKKIVSLFIILFAASASANLPDIVALVNEQPITRYDFESRKNMIVTLNNIEVSDHLSEMKLNSDILNSLIDEELLDQKAQKVGMTISKKSLDEAIESIEQKSNMPANGMRNYLNEQGVDVDTFRKQIRSELIKQNIMSSFPGSISISQNELDTALINNNNQDFAIEAWIFTSKNNCDKSLKNMNSLRNNLNSCENIDEKLYKDFARAEKFDGPLTKLSNRTQSVIMDTKVDYSSPVYKEEGQFNLIFLCKKDRNITKGDLMKVETFLSNKKISQKVQKFFKDLRSKAYIKTMIPG